jgi:hypothetical protein
MTAPDAMEPNETDGGVFDKICPRVGTCVSARDGLVPYRDANHLTARFSSYLSTLLLKQWNL